MSAFNAEEKRELARHLESPVMKKAISEALHALWRSKRGLETLEASAMAFNYHSGACDVLEALHGFTEVPKDFAINPRKLRVNG
jgi:hypothetical protein